VDDPRRGPEQRHVCWIDHPTSAGRDHHCRPRRQFLRDRSLHCPELGFAARGEDFADRHPLAALDLGIEVQKRGPELIGQEWPDGALAGTWQADEDDV
jgi:hypothetical protein